MRRRRGLARSLPSVLGRANMSTDDLIASSSISKTPLNDEAYREYEFGTERRITYRIVDPVALFLCDGGTTHRVLDKAGIVHCLPAPGQNGCVLRWKPLNADKPVAF
jgi:hypothetical protein